MNHFVTTNGIQLHVLEKPGIEPTVLLAHGLTANAHSFGALMAALPYRVLAADLRGRGQSDAPVSGYTMPDHAADLIGLLDALELEQVVMGGHSFGGLLTAYTAVHHPQRVRQCIIIDAGLMHPQVRELITPSLARLGQTYPSWAAYRDTVKAAPYWHGQWDDDIEAYYRADVRQHADDTITPIPTPAAIAEAAGKGLGLNWLEMLARLPQPTLLLNGPVAYGVPGTPAIVPTDLAEQTAAIIPHCRLVSIPGNHMTMLFGENARLMAEAIEEFVGRF
ncbi:MAG TPA: alpha/beta hydrolase [Chloroflexota bacterium]|nr:alpha/beta hydrolase [Chloroflexota bacterium]